MKLPLIFFLALCCLTGYSQKQGQTQLDSLLTDLSKLKDDSNKVKTLSRISQYYYTVDPKESFPYAEKALHLAEQLKWKRGIANLHNNIGLFISDTGNNVLARKHFQISYELNLQLDAKINIINNLNNIGRSYQFESDYSKATDYFFKALSRAEAIQNPDQISLVGTNLTSCFFTQKDYAKASKYSEMTLKYATIANNSRNIIKAHMQLGTIKFELKDTVKAIKHMDKALEIAKSINSKVDEIDILINLSRFYFPDYKKQLAIMLQVKELTDVLTPNSKRAQVNNANLGEVYTCLASIAAPSERANFLKKAEACLSQAKTWAENSGGENLLYVTRILVHLEEEKGNYKQALAYEKKSTALNDSLFSQDKKNEIAGLEGKYNIALKDAEIAIDKLSLDNQRKTQWALIAGLALLGVIGGLLFWQSRNRKKTNTTLMVLNNQLDEANKVKARFFGILSHDLRSPIVNLVNFLHLQKDNPDLMTPEKQAVHQQKISDSADDLLQVMETMLLWSKEQMENFRPNIRNIQVDDLFDHIRKFYGQSPDVTINFEYTPGMVVLTDENYLLTIMQNLTSNAIRALKNTPGAYVEWKAIREGDKTILSITDNGPGIEADLAKSLFDDRIVNNGKNGLGFHLVRDLAKAINYKIALNSENKNGTTFILTGMAA
ncbi:MAG TPA: HAMP domain-containing sensor histidine kinase [Flavitalea sp.]|nr:HAMP domain-containing sensor histidine kinase [Flavitalea sp.]